MRAGWLGVAVLSACGRIGFVALEGEGTDGATIDTSPQSVVTVGNRSDATIQSAMFDVHLDVAIPTVNTGVHRDLHLVPDMQAPLLLHFDLSSLRTGPIIETTLQLWIAGATLPSTTVVVLYRMQEAWDEGSGDYDPGAPNITDRKTGIPWTNAGGSSPTSRDQTGMQVGQGPTALGESITLTVPPNIVDEWRTTNAGVALFAEDSNGSYSEWASSEWPDETQRPLLTIRFAP